MNQVLLHYLKTFGYVLLNLMMAASAVHLLKVYLSCTIIQEFQGWLIILGTTSLLVAGIGRLSWSIQSWSGETTPEKLNNVLFYSFSHVGAFLLFFGSLWELI